MNERQDTMNLVCEFLDAAGYYYDRRDDGRTVRIGCQGCHGRINVLIALQGDPLRLGVFAHLPFVVDEDRRLQVAEALIRANDGLAIGGFDLDMSIGTIEFRAAMPIADATLTADQFEDLLGCARAAADIYFPAIGRLLYGDDLSPAEVIAEVEMAM